MIKSCEVDVKKKTLTIVMDLEKPHPSGSGKTTIIASTGGNQVTTATYEGKAVIVGMNAYYKQ